MITIWEKIYQRYQCTGEEYATLRKDLMPEFVDFIRGCSCKGGAVLDIGCGNGKYMRYLADRGYSVHGIDSSPTAIAMTQHVLQKKTDIILADMYNYDYLVEKYNLVISIAAIHHGYKDQVRAAIINIHKTLVVGGNFFVTLPDNEGSAHWTMMTSHEEIAPGTRIPLNGPEKGLPHSAFTKQEIYAMFTDFSYAQCTLLKDRGRWIVSGTK